MYGDLYLQKEKDGSHYLVVAYPKGYEAEFGLDFLSPQQARDRRKAVVDYLREHAAGMEVKGANILIGGVLVASAPLSVFITQ